MRGAMVIGIILIILGLGSLAVNELSYTTSEKVVDIGPIEVHDKDKHFITIPRVLSLGSVVAGVAVIVATSRKR